MIDTVIYGSYMVRIADIPDNDRARCVVFFADIGAELFSVHLQKKNNLKMCDIRAMQIVKQCFSRYPGKPL